jgi:NAD(P)H-dependent flavin oxidoreductase YrpB (nitropropane dioxygenase family)
LELVARTVGAVETPVLAAGGIADAGAVAAALEAGAAGVARRHGGRAAAHRRRACS